MIRAAVLLAALAVPCASIAAAPPAPAPRAAVLVGAVAPVPGRPVLRHAYRDAETMADVLVSVGGFPRERVHVLRDPDPAALVAAVEREAAALSGAPHGMLFFYYSGHAGDGALFTAGRPLRVDALRRALDRADVSVRIGLVDACEGGDWTRAKGLVADAPFDVALPPIVESEGSALIASSSGAESAHESDALGGSYFTHHFAAALRGAADERHDGEVTLTEAFEYARAQTIRETARQAREPQHPSFAVNLKGRQDLVLAQVSSSPSTLAIDQAVGPLEVVHLGSGLRVLELPAGRRDVVVALPPGKYLVRRVAQQEIRTRELSVPRDGSARVAEADLVLVADERLAVKGEESRDGAAVPARLAGDLEVGLEGNQALEYADGSQIATGTSRSGYTTLRLDGRLGLTDRLTWKVGTLALAYGLGGARGWELVPYGGILGWAADLGGVAGGATSVLGAGVGARVTVGPFALVATVQWQTLLSGPDADSQSESAAVGITVQLGRVATIHVAVAANAGIAATGGRSNGMSLGSVQDLGLRTLPLLALHAPRGWSLNVYARTSSMDGEPQGFWRVGVSKGF